MVLVNGIKYACERCIRGHRVTTCNHTDQPLMMIKPKGRPSTTCAHCKELRKNKNANPTGGCTCGRQQKKRLAQKAKEEARAKAKSKDESCRCIETDKCTCHARRKNRRSVSGKSRITTTTSSIASEESPPMPACDGPDFLGRIAKSHAMGSLPSFHSSQSLDRDFGLATSPVLSPSLSNYHGNSTNWDANSISSLKSDSRVNIPERSHQSIGLDSLHNTRAFSPQARVRVGEASVPMEDFSSDLNSLTANSNFNPSGSSNRMAWPEADSNHGLLDLFADTSENLNTNYMAMKSNLKRNKSSASGLGVMSPQSAGKDPHAQITRSQSYQRDVPKHLISRPSVDSVISHSSKVSEGTNNGREILQSNHSLPFITARQLQPRMSYGGNNFPPGCLSLDDDSTKSVEVLSLTPSFMDIPDNTNFYSATSNPFLHQQKAEPRKRSVSIHRNHRYDSFRDTPSQSHTPVTQQTQSPRSRRGVEVKAEATTRADSQDADSESAFPPSQVTPSGPSMNLSPGADSNSLTQTSHVSSPRDALTNQFMEPTSSFTSEIDHILGANNDDVQSLFSDPTISLDTTNSLNLEASSMGQTNRMPSLCYSETTGASNLDDLDKLMAE
ncbi:LAQU0S06e03400g1_1 [Lachancea quebecensis]|uniref:LAQU0S06e03400g1_1 n=1 Tax=Lachancea quebecensis TaxID=1654605 RepID=A0A0P1KSF7_9SACH|nr:LAQU0S06e03400g1_1 [Lachancea quebecensis]